MNFQKVELHIAQVERAISQCRSDFPNQKKKEIYDSLISLFNGVKASNYRAFSAYNLVITKLALDIVFYGVQHLDYSDENQIPKRLIHCLNYVLNDWIPSGTENYYIVISQNNNLDEFKIRVFDQSDAEALDKLFAAIFSSGYKQALIQISKPRFLFDDYLGSAPAYHELGHFIDRNYSITKSLFRKVDFEPTIVDDERKRLEHHYSEHFADIFAAQYIGESSVVSLNYLAYDSRVRDSHTHPSNEKRKNVVEAFLKGTGVGDSMKIVNNLRLATSARPGTSELKIRNVDLTENPFITLQPTIIDQPEKLHSLYSQGWVNWLDVSSKVRQAYPDASECCLFINKLIKESIELTMQGAVVNLAAPPTT